MPPAQRIQEGSSNAMPLDERAQRVRVAEQREDVGAGQQTAQAVEHLLPSPSIEQPVVNNRRPHGTRIQGGSPEWSLCTNRFTFATEGRIEIMAQTLTDTDRAELHNLVDH